jgi:hypothetical protein
MQVHTTYTPGIGWQYELSDSTGLLLGRYGSFETEQEAMRAGLAHKAVDTRRTA